MKARWPMWRTVAAFIITVIPCQPSDIPTPSEAERLMQRQLTFISQQTQQPTDGKFRVSVRVKSSQNELEARTTVHLSRALRSIPDVVLVPEDQAAYHLSVLPLEFDPLPGGDGASGIFLAVTVTHPFEYGLFAMAVVPHGVSDDALMSMLNGPNWFGQNPTMLQFFVRFGLSEEINELAAQVASIFESSILEPERIARQAADDRHDKWLQEIRRKRTPDSEPQGIGPSDDDDDGAS